MVPKHSLYSASKGAIESFVPCLAVDCGKRRITVNAIAPGGIVTDMFHATAKDYLPHSEDMSEEQIMKVSVPCPLIKDEHVFSVLANRG